MPIPITFRNGCLAYGAGVAHAEYTVMIGDDIVQFAQAGLGTQLLLLPDSYRSDAAVQVVPITSIVADFENRIVDYNTARLLSVIRGIKEGSNLPPLSVVASDNGQYKLENGYHRLLACAYLGFSSIPIDKLPSPIIAKAVPWRSKRMQATTDDSKK